MLDSFRSDQFKQRNFQPNNKLQSVLLKNSSKSIYLKKISRKLDFPATLLKKLKDGSAARRNIMSCQQKKLIQEDPYIFTDSSTSNSTSFLHETISQVSSILS